VGFARFDVDLQLGQPPTVVVNGEKLDPAVFSFVGVRPGTDFGTPAALLLEVAGEGRVEGPGVVWAQSDGNEVEYLRQFIASIDPGELERRALAHQVTINDGPGEGFLKALMEMIG
jgi:hypothetical protein